MRYYLLIIIAIIISGRPVYAQAHMRHALDSMINILPRAAEDTNKVKLLLKIGQAYADANPDTALAYLQRAGTLSEKLDYTEGTYHYLFAMAPVLGEMNRLDDCIAISEKALALSKKQNNKVGIATAFFDIAGAYAQKGQSEKALYYYLETDKALQGSNDTLRLCFNYSKISRAYSVCGQQQKAYEFGMKGIRLSEAMHNDHALSTCLLATAGALSEMGRNDSALTLYNQARDLYVKHNDDYDLITVLVNINHVFRRTGKYDKLLANADIVLALSEKVHRDEGICEGNIEKGTYYFYKKDFVQAKFYANEALKLSLSREHPQTMDECYELLAEINLGDGNIPVYEKYKHLQDSIHNTLISDKILKNAQELQTKYDVAEKENKIKLQQSSLEQNRLEKTILIIALLLITVALLMGVVAYKNKRSLLLSEKRLQQQKIDKLETERQLLATKSVVQGQEEERSRLAKDLHDGLGGILSGAKYSLSNMKENLIITPENAIAFERTMHMLDLSISEMRRVAHNMMPESLMKLNLDEALQDYCEQVSDSGAIAIDYQSTDMDTVVLNDTHKITVYRVIQELINNVLKHAAASTVIVQVFAKEQVLYLTVEDNGKGFEKDQLIFSQGIGYRNIKHRIDYLNGKLDVQSAPGKGTSVYIEIPLQ